MIDFHSRATRESLEVFGFRSSTTGSNQVDSPRHAATRTGNAIVTAGHDFQSGDAVFFEGTPPSPLVAGTRYYARDITATNFSVASSRGTGAITLSGATSGFTAVANWGADEKGTLVIGRGNKFANPVSGGYGAAVQVWGNENDVNWLGIPETVTYQNLVARPFIFGSGNTIRYNSYQGWFFIAGYSNAIQCGTSGATTICLGDQHIGGGHSVAFLGGFHNLANTVGSTDLTTGAPLGVAGTGTILVGAGGLNMQLTGAGVHAYWQGFSFHVSHSNKDTGRFAGTLSYRSLAGGDILANGATRTDEMLTMDYSSRAIVDTATGVDLGQYIFTTRVAMVNDSNFQDDYPVWVGSNGTLPAPLAQDTVYYMDRLTDTTFKLKTAAGGSTVVITNAGTGQFFIQPLGGNMRWLRLFPNKIYEFEISCTVSLRASSPPVWAKYRRRISLHQGAVGTIPTVLESVATAADIGSDLGGNPPVGWSFNITVNTGGLHLSVTTKNSTGSSKHVLALADIRGHELDVA